jgi:DNA polymerase I-like protein with 3'-5' exonuclease and polymerase domains
MGLPTRALAKPAYYGWVYGAGNAKLGLLVGGGEAEGKKMKAGLLKGIPALGKLKEAVAEKAKQCGTIKGVDGRIVPVRAAYSSLNTLLQSAGAVLVKRATIIFHQDLRAANLSEHYRQVCHIHDEIEGMVRDGYEERVGLIAKAAFKKAGEYYNWRCPLDGEWKVGANWKAVH